jgi:hypothetical protein
MNSGKGTRGLRPPDGGDLFRGAGGVGGPGGVGKQRALQSPGCCLESLWMIGLPISGVTRQFELKLLATLGWLPEFKAMRPLWGFRGNSSCLSSPRTGPCPLSGLWRLRRSRIDAQRPKWLAKFAHRSFSSREQTLSDEEAHLRTEI